MLYYNKLTFMTDTLIARESEEEQSIWEAQEGEVESKAKAAA